LPWKLYLSPGQPITLRVTCHKSKLYHSAAVAERVAAAIGDNLGQPPQLEIPENVPTESPPQLIVVRLVNDHCTISIDSSGDLLHRRGYRLATAKAPLRETLAAGMLFASGWDRVSPLLDPFCGSGTIPIEAALLSRRVPPGNARSFAFMNWPDYNPQDWREVLASSGALSIPAPSKIIASDRDAGAIRLAQANAERAGVLQDIEFSSRTISAVDPPDQGWVVTNPPYGLRVSPNKDLRNLYAQLGNVLRLKCPGWYVAILCSDLKLLQQTKLRLDTGITLKNGGVSVRLARGQVKA
jgi:putative N6-adenine-specific DNA methylase